MVKPSKLVVHKINNTKGKKVHETRVIYRRGDMSATIDGTDVQQVYKQIQSKAKEQGKNVQVVIRVLAKDRWLTLKSLHSALNVMDAEDYYSGRVHNPSEFTKFHMLEVTILKRNMP